jgi:2-oxoglutarate ferredoxin oxidoreductase subunit gamma
MRQELRLAGFGGQGVISMGFLLAVAAGKYENKEVAQTQSYGPEARGGACKTELIISDTEIDYIKAIKPDVLVAMSQPALDRYVQDIDMEKSILIVDETMVSTIPANVKNVKKIPAVKFAEEQLKAKVVANVFMMGALVKLTGIVSSESCKKAIAENMPAKTVDLNLAAFDAGVQYAERM